MSASANAQSVWRRLQMSKGLIEARKFGVGYQLGREFVEAREAAFSEIEQIGKIESDRSGGVTCIATLAQELDVDVEHLIGDLREVALADVIATEFLTGFMRGALHAFHEKQSK